MTETLHANKCHTKKRVRILKNYLFKLFGWSPMILKKCRPDKWISANS